MAQGRAFGRCVVHGGWVLSPLLPHKGHQDVPQSGHASLQVGGVHRNPRSYRELQQEELTLSL